MNDPIISVILPVFNNEYTISYSLESIFSQTLNRFEIICIDDASVDNTLNKINNFTSDKRLKLISNETNIGAANSRNKGINESIGRYIAFLDSDDIWFPNKLEKQINFMHAHNCPVVCSSYYRLLSTKKRQKVVSPPNYISYQDMLKSNFIGFPTSVIDTKQVGKRYFRPFRVKEDYIFWLDLFRDGFYALGMQDILAIYSASNKLAKKGSLAKNHWWVYRDIENFNILKSSYYFINYSILGLIKSFF